MISAIVIVSVVLIVVALTISWAIYKKNDNEEDIKKISKTIASIIFYGVVVFIISVTLIKS